jgi:DNA repair photolyase
MFAPVIPFLNDHELESVLEQAAEAGARWAGYVVVRLPHEIKDLFREWLTLHEPLKAERIMNTIRELRGGRDNDPEFFSRQRGSGPFAGLIRSRFEKTCEKLGLNRESKDLRTDLFRPPRPDTPQFDLF